MNRRSREDFQGREPTLREDMRAKAHPHTRVQTCTRHTTKREPRVNGDHGILQARILEWGAFPFSRGSSQPRDRTQVSCIAGGFFTK